MILDLIMTVLWSLSPFGEAKLGIPYGIMKGLNEYVVFFACFLANIAVFPLMMFFLDRINQYFLKWRFYKKSAVFIAKRAKTGSGDKIKKFGFLGLMFFVMIPLPGTGVYAGTIASHLFRIERKQAFLANATGIFFSSLIVWTVTVFSTQAM